MPLTAREAARLTTEKIDQIESEMIRDTSIPTATTSHGGTNPTSAQEPVATAVAPAGGEPRAAPAIDITASSLPPELEEAAILYANNQLRSAIAALQPTRHADGRTPGYDRLVWLVLLDLCQFSGDRERFDTLSVEYAARFETSPPAWNSRQAAPEADSSADGPAVGAARALPATLDGGCAKTVDALLRSAREREPVVDFSAVRAVDAEGATQVLRLFDGVGGSGARLRVKGASALAAAARAAIEPGGEAQSAALWRLAMYGLRLQGQTQQFDDLSIDYCVTFEVSPPPWEPVPAGIAVGEGEAQGDATEDEAPAEWPSTRVGGAMRIAAAFALRGELIGRIQAELQSLRAHARDRSEVAIDCRGLRRLDFVAAGELLNEVVNMQGQGKNLLFIEPNHAVYALMLVMGIHELAEIRRRKG